MTLAKTGMKNKISEIVRWKIVQKEGQKGRSRVVDKKQRPRMKKKKQVKDEDQERGGGRTKKNQSCTLQLKSTGKKEEVSWGGEGSKSRK